MPSRRPDAEPTAAAEPVPTLHTDRLVLRDWRDTDLAPFAELNADPVVMEHFPSTLTTEQTAATIRTFRSRWSELGCSWWAVEERASRSLIGAVGLNVVTFDAPFNDAAVSATGHRSVEVGWRLRRSAWGHGFATEAALAALDWGFSARGPDEIVSFTAVDNRRSRRVMERIGMTHDPAGDFDHPRVPPGHRLERHVLYRLPRPARQ